MIVVVTKRSQKCTQYLFCEEENRLPLKALNYRTKGRSLSRPDEKD